MVIATGLGLGYLPKAPGTWGSVGGVALGWLGVRFWFLPGLREIGEVVLGVLGSLGFKLPTAVYILVALPYALILVVVIAIGIGAAGRAASYVNAKDPQVVVIDEVSGQMVSLLPMIWFSPLPPIVWKYFLLGFILFRVFDIWKPWPARAAEKLPGGWGIMADDWVAGVYAAGGLWLARAFGL